MPRKAAPTCALFDQSQYPVPSVPLFDWHASRKFFTLSILSLEHFLDLENDLINDLHWDQLRAIRVGEDEITGVNLNVVREMPWQVNRLVDIQDGPSAVERSEERRGGKEWRSR